MIHEFTADAREANRIANQLRGGNRAELGRKGALEKNAAGRWRFARGGAK